MMGSSRKATHVVMHRNQFLSVGGKLQRLAKGTEIVLSAEQGARLAKRGRVMVIGQQEAVDLTASDDGDGDRLKELKARAAELGIEGASRWGESRLTEAIATAEAVAAGIGE